MTNSLDEAEYQKLSKMVDQIEKSIKDGSIPSSDMMANLLMNAKHRMGDLEQSIDGLVSQEKRDKAGLLDVAIAEMVMRETRLNDKEKEAYAQLLEKDHFTRDDFGKLESFYADGGGYDKLSEDGKDAITERIQRGIDRGSFQASDLPSRVKNKVSEKSGQESTTAKQQGSFDYIQQEYNQAASEHSELAVAPVKNLGINAKNAVKDEMEKDLLNRDDSNSLASLGQSPTDLTSSASMQVGRS